MLNALRRRGARWIVGLHALDLTVEYASSVALMVLVYDATGSPLAAAAMLVAKQIVPGALLMLGGARLDGVDARRGLAWAYLLRGAAFAGLAAFSGAALYVLAFVAGIAGVSSRVMIRATVARAFSGQTFRELTAAQNVVFGAMTLVGPALGALGAAGLGGAASLGIWGAVAAVLAGVALTMPAALRRGQPAGDEAAAGAAAHETEASPLRQPRRAAPAWTMLALAATLAVLFAMDEPALLAYVRESLGAGTGAYGAILVAWGVGVLLGGLIYARSGLGAPLRSVIAGVAAAALGYVGLGFAPSLSLALAAAVLGGVGNGIYWVAIVTAVLEQAAPGRESAVSGRLEGIVTAMPALGILLGGAVAQWIDPRVTLWAPGLVALAVLAAWALLAIRPTLLPAPEAPPSAVDAASPRQPPIAEAIA